MYSHWVQDLIGTLVMFAERQTVNYKVLGSNLYMFVSSHEGHVGYVPKDGISILVRTRSKTGPVKNRP